MKRKYVLAAFVIMAFLMAIDLPRLMSSTCPAFPPPGACGDPTTNSEAPCAPAGSCTCAFGGCHPGPTQAASSATSLLQIVDSAGFINGTASYAPFTNSFRYIPGEAYYVALELNSSNPSGRYGFEMTMLNPDSSMAGSFYVTDHTHNFLQTDSAGVQYISHRNAISNFLNWNYVWTAPATNKTVTVYYTYNLSDSAALPNPGGVIYQSSFQIQSTTSAIKDLNGKISDLDIFPNPTSSDFTLSFNLKESNPVNVSVYSVDGRLVGNLLSSEKEAEGNFRQSFSLDNLTNGVYLIKLGVGDAAVTQKITKM